MAEFDLVIRGGTVVTAAGASRRDLPEPAKPQERFVAGFDPHSGTDTAP